MDCDLIFVVWSLTRRMFQSCYTVRVEMFSLVHLQIKIKIDVGCACGEEESMIDRRIMIGDDVLSHLITTMLVVERWLTKWMVVYHHEICLEIGVSYRASFGGGELSSGSVRIYVCTCNIPMY